MRKLMIVAAMLAMTALVAAPALAQSSFDFDNNDLDRGDFFDLFDGDNDNFDNGFFDLFDNNDFDNPFFDNGIEQETDETGNVDLNSEIVNTGNNSNQCAAPLQFGNTGNLQNAQTFNQFDSEADDIEFEGSTFEFAPEQAVECGQGVFQSAAANG